VGRHYSDFALDGQNELVLEMDKAFHCGKELKEVPVCFYRKNGSVVPLLLDTNVSYSEDGNFHHTRCFFRDDTCRRHGAFYTLVYLILQSQTLFLKTYKSTMSCSSLPCRWILTLLPCHSAHGCWQVCTRCVCACAYKYSDKVIERATLSDG
jgi:hypothetical protein